MPMPYRATLPVRSKRGAVQGGPGCTKNTSERGERILDARGSAGEDRRCMFWSLPGPYDGRTTLAYVLILTTMTSYGASNTQQVARFSNYHDCVRFAVAWTDRGRSPNSTVQWRCERTEKMKHAPQFDQRVRGHHRVTNAPVQSPIKKPGQAPSVTQNIGSVISHTFMA